MWASLQAAVAVVILASICHGAEGDWPVWRHDAALTGRTALQGELRDEPAVAWSYSLTGMQGLLVMDPQQAGEASTATCDEPLGAGYLNDTARSWGVRPFVYELAAGKTLVLSESATRRVGKIHPDLPEPQQVTFTDAKERSRLTLTAWDTPDGSPRVVWSSPPGKAATERWNICFGDVDGDGIDEIVVAGHLGVMVYDPRDGKLKTECRYGHRSRGLIAVADIDGDGADEFLNVALFQIAVEVCDYADGKLRVLWGDKIELDIFAHPRMILTPFDALCDIDGDGKHEAIYNIYNDHGDEQWHLVIRDALTGDVRWDIPKTVLNDSVDLDGDGCRELVGIHTEGRFCQGFGPAFIAHLKPGGLDELWSRDAARWPYRRVRQMPRDRSTFRSAGNHNQVCTGRFDGDGRTGLLFSERPDEAGTPEVFHTVRALEDGSYAVGWSVTAPASTRSQVEAIADIDGDGVDEVLLRWRSNGREAPVATGSGASPRIVSWQPLMPRAGPPIAADLHGKGELTVLATSAVDEVVAIAPPGKANDGPRERWRRPGRGHDSLNCLAAADLDGDGRGEVVFVGEAPSGKARVTATDGDGKTEWHVDFDDIHGQRGIFRLGGLTHLWVAHLTDPKRADVLVSVTRSIMHSDVGYALQGTDGKLLWRQDKAGRMGYGGSGLAFADPDGDGLDTVFCGYPICYWRADGRTGELTSNISPGSVLPDWPAYAIPIVADFNDDGKPEVFFPSTYVWGLLTLEGECIWHLPSGDVPLAQMPGIADVDGNGKLALGGPFRDGFRCYDAATGELKWRVPIPSGRCRGTLSADVNGDGRDEFLLVAGMRLIAVGTKDGAGAIIWQVELPGSLGEPSFADVDGDGKGEVLVVCGDGNLYCLDREPD